MSGLLFGGSNKVSNTIAPEVGLHVQTSAYGNPLPIVYGTNRTSGNMIWYGDFTQIPVSSSSGGGKGGRSNNAVTSYEYSTSFLMAISEGQIQGIGKVWIDNKLHETNDVFTVFNGSYSQTPWGYLTTNHAENALNYRGIAYVAVANYNLGSSANLPNHSLEVKGVLSDSVDANPADVINDYLTNPHYGVGFDSANIANLDSFKDYCTATGIKLSPIFDSQKQAFENINDLIQLCNSGLYYSEGKLKIVPFGDQAITAHGVTWTPNVTPIYALNDDDFISDNLEPVIVNRNTPADAFNRVKIEYVNRENNYNTQVETASDLANAEVYGLREKDTIVAHQICLPSVAQTIAQIVLQRATYIRNTYEFTVGVKYCALEPTDYITITDTTLGLTNHPLRILSIEEDSDYTYKIVAEDAPPGVSSRAIYSTPAVEGFIQNYSVDPGNVVDPVFFEPPVELAPTTGLEVWCAVTGNNDYWGGCNVWFSSDGDSYSFLTRFENISEYGTITSSLSDTDTSVNISLVGRQPRTLVSASSADVALLRTLCYISGIETEFVAYDDVELTGENAYTLSLAVRGAYGSSPENHTTASKFVVMNEFIVKSAPLQDFYVGKNVYFKFTSFNIYGGNEQSLADVSPYSYTITGEMLRFPPENVGSFTNSILSDGVKLIWTNSTDPLVKDYEIRLGATWSTATSLGFFAGTTTTIPPLTTASYTALIKARDKYLNQSTDAVSQSFTINRPSAVTCSVSQNGLDYLLIWNTPISQFKIDYYLIYQGATFGTASLLAKNYTTDFKSKITFGGTAVFWIAPVDIAGNIGTESSVSLVITSPATPSITSNVIDNNVLLYWSDATTSLTIETYIIKRGDNLETAQFIGEKQGLFTTVFEASSGTYRYWIAGRDFAGNVGDYGYIDVLVNQPPDYVLVTDGNSVFDGTLSNAVPCDTGILMPVNSTETWAQHYINNSFSTPQNQIDAGFPVYILPSVDSGYYEEVIDFGVSLGVTNINVTPTIEIMYGTPTFSVTLSLSNTSPTSGYTDYPNTTQILASDFRYLKIKIIANSTGNNDILCLRNLYYRLDVKTKTDAGNGVASSSDSSGTTVNFNIQFLAVDSILVTPQSSSFVIATYIFTSTPNPTSFKVMLFNSSGERVNGNFSWTVRGK